MITSSQADRLMDDAKRIALITNQIQCSITCLRLAADRKDVTWLEPYIECLDGKSMLASGIGSSLVKDIQGMVEGNSIYRDVRESLQRSEDANKKEETHP